MCDKTTCCPQTFTTEVQSNTRWPAARNGVTLDALYGVHVRGVGDNGANADSTHPLPTTTFIVLVRFLVARLLFFFSFFFLFSFFFWVDCLPVTTYQLQHIPYMYPWTPGSRICSHEYTARRGEQLEKENGEYDRLTDMAVYTYVKPLPFCFQPLRLDIKRKLTARSDRVKCVDLHPKEPWMLASLYNGNVHIWNHETATLIKSYEVSWHRTHTDCWFIEFDLSSHHFGVQHYSPLRPRSINTVGYSTISLGHDYKNIM